MALQELGARPENCLFVGNIANTGMDEIATRFGLTYNAEHGCGAVTVFPDSRVQVRRCTFTENWNGVDDRGVGNRYQECIFWQNTASDGSRPGAPYEIDILDAAGVRDCYFGPGIGDLRGTVDPSRNVLRSEDPAFDQQYVPRSPAYASAGFRPAGDGPES